MEAPTGLKKPVTFDHLKKKAPVERRVRIPLSQDAVDTFDAATEAYERAKILGEPTEALAEALAVARTAVEESSVVMLFRCIGRKAYDDLLEAHPPTDDQVKEFQDDNPNRDGTPNTRGRPPYNIETFPAALVAASCVEPEMTYEQVCEIFDEWNSTEVSELWVAALEVNTQRRVVQLGNV